MDPETGKNLTAAPPQTQSVTPWTSALTRCHPVLLSGLRALWTPRNAQAGLPQN